MGEEPALTLEQWRAVDSLGRALKRAARAGLIIFGMDNNLLALPREEFEGARGTPPRRHHGGDARDGGRGADRGPRRFRFRRRLVRRMRGRSMHTYAKAPIFRNGGGR